MLGQVVLLIPGNHIGRLQRAAFPCFLRLHRQRQPATNRTAIIKIRFDIFSLLNFNISQHFETESY